MRMEMTEPLDSSVDHFLGPGIIYLSGCAVYTRVVQLQSLRWSISVSGLGFHELVLLFAVYFWSGFLH